MTLTELQVHIRRKDHQPHLQHDYFLKLIEEIGELSDAVRTNTRMVNDNIKGTIEEELADVLYYVAALANVYDVELEKCFALKDSLNHVKYGS